MLTPLLGEEDAVTGTVAYPQRADTLTDRVHITEIAGFKPANAHDDPCCGVVIAKLAHSFSKDRSLADVDRLLTAVNGFSLVNQGSILRFGAISRLVRRDIREVETNVRALLRSAQNPR